MIQTSGVGRNLYWGDNTGCATGAEIETPKASKGEMMARGLSSRLKGLGSVIRVICTKSLIIRPLAILLYSPLSRWMLVSYLHYQKGCSVLHHKNTAFAWKNFLQVLCEHSKCHYHHVSPSCLQHYFAFVIFYCNKLSHPCYYFCILYNLTMQELFLEQLPSNSFTDMKVQRTVPKDWSHYHHHAIYRNYWALSGVQLDRFWWLEV